MRICEKELVGNTQWIDLTGWGCCPLFSYLHKGQLGHWKNQTCKETRLGAWYTARAQRRQVTRRGLQDPRVPFSKDLGGEARQANENPPFQDSRMIS